MIVNRIWSLNDKLSKKKLHKLFYNDLVALGFRAHHSKNGKKPILKKLSARIDKYDYKINLNAMILILKLHNGYEVKLELLVLMGRFDKFRNWSNYEIVVKHDDGNSGYQYTSRELLKL
jgi:putative transposase